MKASQYRTCESGSSLVEAVVAVALLMTVVGPLSVTLVFVASHHHNADRIEALAIGQRYIEEMLHSGTFVTEEFWEDQRKWRVVRQARQEDDHVVLMVLVYRRADLSPYMELCTIRLL